VPQQLNLIDLTKAPISGSGNLASGVIDHHHGEDRGRGEEQRRIGYIKATGCHLVRSAWMVR
jgi:hypothetical protein